MNIETTADAAIIKLEAEFKAGRIVEAIEGNFVRPYALIRPARDVKAVTPLMLGTMTAVDFENVLNWHGQKWEELLQDKDFSDWAEANPFETISRSK